MLTAEQIDALTDSATVRQRVQQAELDIIEDMARRISKMNYSSGTTRWQMQKLLEMGAQKKYIYKKLSEATNKSVSDLATLFGETGVKALENDQPIYSAQGISPVSLAENKGLQQVLQAGMNQTQNMFNNLTQQTAINATQQFGEILDRSFLQISSGAFTYDTAIQNAIKELARAGITAIKYQSGRKDSIDVAARRALLTGINQTALNVSLTRATQLGVALVETSAHIGARKDHALWQGKVFQLVGSSAKYPNFYTATGYGTASGLGGPNCRHSFYPFFADSTPSYNQKELDKMNDKKVTVFGKEVPVEEALQTQRGLERAVRKWKREEKASKGAGLKDGETSARAKVKDYQKKLRDFTEETGLKRDYIRERVL